METVDQFETMTDELPENPEAYLSPYTTEVVPEKNIKESLLFVLYALSLIWTFGACFVLRSNFQIAIALLNAGLFGFNVGIGGMSHELRRLSVWWSS